jgi:sirohydrochlorin cobaltochelatase
VDRDDFSDAALVLLGHGSTQNAGSAAPVFQHAARLRRRKIFVEVREAFWKQEPRVQNVLSEISARRVFIVPLFISEGYFSDQMIPRALGFPPGQSTLNSQLSTFFFCKPIGTHESMAAVVLDRAIEVAKKFPFPRQPKPTDTTLFIAGHGTDRNENSRKAVERQVELMRAKNLYADVHGIFLEEEPRIGNCYSLARTKNIVIVPFFISDGMHTREDIPVLLGEPKRIVQQRLAAGQPVWRNPTERRGKLVWYAPGIGSDPQIADVILERVKEAAG